MTARVKSKKKVQIRTSPLSVGGDDYLVRTNLSMKQAADLNSGDDDRIIAFLRGVILEHPWDVEDIGELEMDEITKIVEAYGALLKALPPA